MPAKSIAQRRYFGAIAGGAIPQPKGMSDKTVHDFAATKENGLPKHMADGGKAPIMTKRRYFGQQGPNVMGGPPKMMADGGEAADNLSRTQDLMVDAGRREMKIRKQNPQDSRGMADWAHHDMQLDAENVARQQRSMNRQPGPWAGGYVASKR